MQDLKQLRTQIKECLDRESTADLLSFLGYEVTRDWKFKLRPDERTASAAIRADGYLKDFGSDWGGDIVSLLHEHHGQSLKDATLYVADCLKLDHE